MSQQQYIKILEAELRKLNEEIDRKIISGQIYVREAKRHKELLRKIHQHTVYNGYFRKLASFIRSIFVYA